MNKRQVTLISSNNLCVSLEKTIDAARDFAKSRGSNIGSPIFILVPDRATLQTERLLLRDNDCLLNVRVVTFSMLFNIVSKERASNVLDKTRAVLFMWRAVQAVADKLVWFGKSASQYAFAERMFNTVNQLTSSLVDFEKLESNASGEVTRKKMHDIALIWRKYKELIGEYTDSAGMLGYLIDNIATSEIASGAQFFIAGFDYMSMQRGAVVAEILRCAAGCTVGAREGSEFARFVEEVVFDQQAVCKVQKFEGKSFTNLAVHVRAASNLQEECNFIANQICAIVKSGRARFREIAVALADFENCAKVCEQIFLQNGIAVNTDVGESLLFHPLSLFLRDIIAAAATGKNEHYVSVIKSRYSEVSLEQQFESENKMLGTGEVPPVKEVQSVKKCSTVEEFCWCFKEILVGAERNALGLAPEEEQREAVARRKVAEVLDACEEILGAQKMKATEFLQLFCTLASASKVSSIPMFSDAVIVVDIREMQPIDVPFLFVGNATEDSFPACQADTDIITESDIENMSVRIEPRASLQNIRAWQHAINVLCSGSEQVFVSFTGENRSELLEKVEHSPLVEDIWCRTFAQSMLLRAVGSGEAFDNPAYYNAILRSLDIANVAVPDFTAKVFPVARGRELFFPSGSAAVTQIEKYNDCPYLHFLSYGLRAQRREIAGGSANLMGTLIHKFAEKFIKRVIEKGFEAQGEHRRIVDEVLCEFPHFVAEPLNRPIIAAFYRECKRIAKAFVEDIKIRQQKGGYFPRFTEKELQYKMGGLTFKGVADRVDVSDDRHAVIIDYKTGSSAEFTKKDIQRGAKLQLPLYMNFLREEGFIADCAFYMFIRGGFKQSGDKALFETKGIRADDEIVERSILMLKEAVDGIVAGRVEKKPFSDKVCRRCSARTMCFERQVSHE